MANFMMVSMKKKKNTVLEIVGNIQHYSV